MSATFPCPHCGAEYGFDQVEPGMQFSCGECGGEVVAPMAEEPKPATVTRTRAPARGSSAARSPAAKSTSRSAPAAKAARGTKKNAPAAKKSGLPPAALIGGGAVLVIGIIAAIALSGGSKGTNGGTNGGGTSEVPAEMDVPAELEKIATRIHGGTRRSAQTASEAWTWSNAYRAETEKLQGSSAAERRLQSRLTEAANQYEKAALDLDPDFAPYHEKLGNRKYAGELQPYMDAAWLIELEQNEARRLHEKLVKDSEKTKGWLPVAKFKDFDELIAKLEPKKAAHEAMAGSDWFKKAQELDKEIQADVAKRFEAVKDVKFNGMKMFTKPPYVWFVEDDSGWNPNQVADSESKSILAILDFITAEWGGIITLPNIEGPVPILYFRNARNYQIYAQSPGAAAHFEPDTGRLALNSQCETSTLIHEGTHQVLFNIISHALGRRAQAQTESFWFHEGMAEWYGGSSRKLKEPSGWDYSIGGFQAERLNFLDTSTDEGRKYLYTLPELLELSYGDRARMQGSQMLNVYSQAWFFIWFLNHFNVDSEGRVDPRKPGIYREEWKRFVKATLLGKGATLQQFKQETGFSDADLTRIEEEYWRFYLYAVKKSKLRQINMKERKLVAWDDYVNQRGEKTGEPEDDLLPPLNRERMPLRKKE